MDFGKYHLPKSQGFSLLLLHHLDGIVSTRHPRALSEADATGIDGALCLIDDVLVFGKDKKEHDDRLKTALKRIEAAGVMLNSNKC